MSRSSAGASASAGVGAVGFSPVHEAARLGRCDILNSLSAAGAVLDERCATSGRTPLQIASSLGHVDAVRSLLSKGARADIPVLENEKEKDDDREGGDAEMTTAAQGVIMPHRHRHRYAFHLAKNEKTRGAFREALFQCIGMGNAEAVGALLDGGVVGQRQRQDSNNNNNNNIQEEEENAFYILRDGSTENNTALHWAVTFKHVHVLEILLSREEFHTHVDAANRSGVTALHEACKALVLSQQKRWNENEQAHTYAQGKEVDDRCVSMLLRHGASLQVRDAEGVTPLDLLATAAGQGSQRQSNNNNRDNSNNKNINNSEKTETKTGTIAEPDADAGTERDVKEAEGSQKVEEEEEVDLPGDASDSESVDSGQGDNSQYRAPRVVIEYTPSVFPLIWPPVKRCTLLHPQQTLPFPGTNGYNQSQSQKPSHSNIFSQKGVAVPINEESMCSLPRTLNVHLSIQSTEMCPSAQTDHVQETLCAGLRECGVEPSIVSPADSDTHIHIQVLLCPALFSRRQSYRIKVHPPVAEKYRTGTSTSAWLPDCNSKIVLEGSCLTSVYYAVLTFCQLLRHYRVILALPKGGRDKRTNGTLTKSNASKDTDLGQGQRQNTPHLLLPAVFMEDWPDTCNRAVMLDIARGRAYKITELLNMIDRLSAWKINQLQLRFDVSLGTDPDKASSSAGKGKKKTKRNLKASSSSFSSGSGTTSAHEEGGRFSRQDLCTLQQRCVSRFIELVPMQESLGHMQKWLKQPRFQSLAEHPDGVPLPFPHDLPYCFKCTSEKAPSSQKGGGKKRDKYKDENRKCISVPSAPFSLCPTDPRVFPFLDNIYTELFSMCPNFSSSFSQINICTSYSDSFGLDIGKPVHLPSTLHSIRLPQTSKKKTSEGGDNATLKIKPTAMVGRSSSRCSSRGRSNVYMSYMNNVIRIARAAKQSCLDNGNDGDYLQTRSRSLLTIQFWGDAIVADPELARLLPPNCIALIGGAEAGHPFHTQAAALGKAGLPFYLVCGTSSSCSIGGRLSNAIDNIAAAAIQASVHHALGLMIADNAYDGGVAPLSVSLAPMLVAAGCFWSSVDSAAILHDRLDSALSPALFELLIGEHIFDGDMVLANAVITLGNVYMKATDKVEVKGDESTNTDNTSTTGTNGNNRVANVGGTDLFQLFRTRWGDSIEQFEGYVHLGQLTMQGVWATRVRMKTLTDILSSHAKSVAKRTGQGTVLSHNVIACSEIELSATFIRFACEMALAIFRVLRSQSQVKGKGKHDNKDALFDNAICSVLILRPAIRSDLANRLLELLGKFARVWQMRGRGQGVGLREATGTFVHLVEDLLFKIEGAENIPDVFEHLLDHQ